MNYPEYIYENTRRVGYDLGDDYGTAYILPVCTNCGRYVKMDESINWNEYKGISPEPNATCSRCGRIHLGIEMID